MDNSQFNMLHSIGMRCKNIIKEMKVYVKENRNVVYQIQPKLNVAQWTYIEFNLNCAHQARLCKSFLI